MLRKFRIKLNDKEYEVEMEEIGNPGNVGFAPTTPTAPAPMEAAAPAPTQAPAPAAPAAAPVELAGDEAEIIAPMPGNILDVKVKVGDVVKTNDVLLVLEAMKMENNIVSPKDGTVVAILVTKGSTIDVGETMILVR